MNQEGDYSKYTATGFFTDDQFIMHVLNGNNASAAYWKLVAERHPELVGAMEEAQAWILLLNKQTPYRPQATAAGTWTKIEAGIATYEYRKQRYRPLRVAARWIGAAAACLLVLMAIRELSEHGKRAYATGFGKREQIILPDESVVTLNGNSNIHYSRTWRSDKPREIWLDGEAFFEVKHVAIKNRLRQSDSFYVHVGGLDLTVLGTRFNVRNRRHLTEVSLLEGSLRIARTGPGAFVRILKPGEAFVWDSTHLLLNSMERKPAANKAWTHDEMDLDGYTLQEILYILQDTYGYNITLQSPELATRRLTGTIPAQNAEDILFVLKKVFNLKIDQKDNHLIISQN